MALGDNDQERPPASKRLKHDHNGTDAQSILEKRAVFLSSLGRGVSPPPNRSIMTSNEALNTSTQQSSTILFSTDPAYSERAPDIEKAGTIKLEEQSTSDKWCCTSSTIKSPVQLTRIRDLPNAYNLDAVSLHDIIADPLIDEAWIFNFCFDVDWLMDHFDQDTRHLVKVKIIHGSWRREDMNKIMIDDACRRMSNVEAIQAYLPDSFGTHHSKMFVLLRHDDQAQIVIHTANMLAKDWTNMSQAVWRSPLLPLKTENRSGPTGALGSGSRFQHDLSRYLQAYGAKLKPLVQKIDKYDFTSVKATLIASVPSYFKLTDENVWGHEALRRAIGSLPNLSPNPHFVFQASSIASLPAKWLKESLYRAVGASADNLSIVFPTAEDVRNSLDGYSAGASIHMKAQKDIHLKQIAALRPQLCRWTRSEHAKTGRHRAAPHIKTYIRFAGQPSVDNPAPEIEWALVTSANLSTQAWGSAAKAPKGSINTSDAIVHIQSFEIGVLFWPAMFAAEGMPTSMVPTFRNDMPAAGSNLSTLVGFRMPYDLPLTHYADNELPWSPHSVYTERDVQGFRWGLDET